MALVGAIAFLITFLTVIAGAGEDSVFGYGFLPGILTLVIWSTATSILRYRAVASTAGEVGARKAMRRAPPQDEMPESDNPSAR